MGRLTTVLLLISFATLGCRVLPPEPKRPVPADGTLAGADTDGPGSTRDSATEDTGDTVVSSPYRAVVLVLDGARIDETFGDGTSSVTGESTDVFLTEIRALLLPRGTVVDLAMNAGTTITAEGHAALLTGRRVHLANMPSDDGPGVYVPDIPTIFQQLRQTRGLSTEQTMLVANTVHLAGHVASNHPGRTDRGGYSLVTAPDSDVQPANDDGSVLDAVRDVLASQDAHLVVANLHQIDRAGHYNARRQAYAERVKDVDTPIAALWNWIQTTPPYADHTILVVVSDHGRHRHGTPEDYRHHGDQCAGCRQVPLLWLGPGIRRGATVTEPANLADVGQTLAWLLNVPLPHSTGRVLHEILETTADVGDAQSVRTVATAAGAQASSTRLGVGAATQVWLNDEIVSDPAALLAEGPVLAAHGDVTVLCWRELHWAEGDLSSWPWQPSCLRQPSEGSEWQPLSPPVETVAMDWEPSLTVDPSGDLWMSMVDNSSGYWENEDQAVRLLHWSPSAGWRGMVTGATDVRGAAGATHVRTIHGTWVSVVTSDVGSATDDPTPTGDPGVRHRARYRRHAVVYRVDVDEELGNTWTKVWRAYTADHYSMDAVDPAPEDAWDGWREIHRSDHAVLSSIDDLPVLAFVGFGDDGSAALWTARSCGIEDSWCEPEAVEGGSGALPHVPPVWDGNTLYWGRWDGGPSICRTRIGTASEGVSCVDGPGTAIERIAVAEGIVTVTAYVDGHWKPEDVTW